MQVNDTHIQCPLKQRYRHEEAENKNKVQTPDCSDIIHMTIVTWQKIAVDCAHGHLNLIPPIGILRKNAEGSKLLDYMEYDTDGEDHETACTSDDDPEDNEESSTLEIASTSVPPPNAEASCGFVPLAGNCYDTEINSDATFLDSLGNLLHNLKTSTFLPRLIKVHATYDDARCSVKKRIETFKDWLSVLTMVEYYFSVLDILSVVTSFFL